MNSWLTSQIMSANFIWNIFICFILFNLKISAIIHATVKPDEFVFSQRPLNYRDAIKFCHEKKMVIVKITNAETNKRVFEFAKSKRLREYWINVYYRQQEKDYRHIDGSEIFYTNWVQGQPDNFQNDQSCVRSGGYLKEFWDDIFCSSSHTVICGAYLQLNSDPFYLLPKTVNFTTAVKLCQENGMSLIRIDDANTNKIVFEYAKRKSLGLFWIDVNHRQKENDYVHLDGSKVIYTNWQPSQPDNFHNKQSCVRSGDYLNELWDDIECNSEHRGICNTTNVTLIENQFHLLPEPVNFDTAVKLCQKKGMSLIKIDEVNENKLVYRYALAKNIVRYWIDANDQSKENEFRHVDGSKVTYTNWLPFQPDNKRNNEHCVESGTVFFGLWNDRDCQLKISGICTATKKSFDENQFYLLPIPVNFEKAVQLCEERGMSLIRIDDSNTNKMVHQYAVEKKLIRYWIDANDRVKEKEFVHIDGSKVTYHNWLPHQPDNAGNKENCVESGTFYEGLWNDENCKTILYGICNATKKSFDKNQFYLLPKPVNFETAKKLCEEKGMSLIKIDNADTNNIVFEYATKKGLGLYWTDINHRKKENDYVHIDGSKVKFTNWQPTQPDNFNDTQSCVRSGGYLKAFWDDIECSMEHQIICNATVTAWNGKDFQILSKLSNNSTVKTRCKDEGIKLLKVNSTNVKDLVFRDCQSLTEIDFNSFKKNIRIDDELYVFSNSNMAHGTDNEKVVENISEILNLKDEILKYLKLTDDLHVICYSIE